MLKYPIFGPPQLPSDWKSAGSSMVHDAIDVPGMVAEMAGVVA